MIKILEEMYNPATVKQLYWKNQILQTANIIIQSSWPCLSQDIRFWPRRQCLYEPYKRVALKTMRCSMVDVKQSWWIQKRVNGALHLMLSRGASYVNSQEQVVQSGTTATHEKNSYRKITIASSNYSKVIYNYMASSIPIEYRWF